MTDDVLADLITAIVAARADGDGVLTIAAVRARLAAAKLCVRRAEEESAEAGIQTGDIVIDVDGEPVRSAAALHNRIGLTPPVCEWQRRLLPQAGSRARAPVARTARP